MDDKENGMNGGRVEIIPPAKERRYKRPLSTLGGLISETARIYRRMKAGKLDHDVGRSLVWVLAQQRAMLEAEALERIEKRLDELSEHAEQRYGQRGGREVLRLPN